MKDSATSYLDMATSAIVEGLVTQLELDGDSKASKCLAAPQLCCDSRLIKLPCDALDLRPGRM